MFNLVFKRMLSTKVEALTFKDFGKVKNLFLQQKNIENPRSNQIIVKMLASSINPSDINQIEGKYPILPSGNLKTPGNEGVGEIESLGPNVTKLKKGDQVIPRESCFGTWRTHVLTDEDKVLKVSKDIPVEFVATLAVNPCTAFRLLNDFVNLQPGDVVVQNGANSAVGKAVIQIARSMGLKTINIIRKRKNYSSTVELLKSLGADIVVKENFTSTNSFNMLVEDLPAPKLGLNCVGGKSVISLSSLLSKGSTIVTYGGMSKEPLKIPTSHLIFKDLQFKGFWLTDQIKNHSDIERIKMIENIIEMIKNGDYKPIVKIMKFSDYENALELALSEYKDRKIIFKFD